MNRVVVAFMTAFFLTGCQSANLGKSASLDNTTFMSLWETYRTCESGTDLDSMQLAAIRLSHVARQPEIGPAIIPLPKAIQRWVSDPPSRLAVDVKSMAAACTLYTGQAALSVGRNDLADQMFQAVLHNPTSSSYYIQQARAGLAQAIMGAQASRTSGESTVRLADSSF